MHKLVAAFDASLRQRLIDRLAAVGGQVADCERVLLAHGFRGCEVYDAMYRALGEGPQDDAAYERYKAERAAHWFSGSGGPAVKASGSLPPGMRAFEEGGYDDRAPRIEAMLVRFREVFREDAHRFAGALDDRPFDSKEHRIGAIKWGAERVGVDVSKSPGLAELRSVVGVQVERGVCVVGALSAPSAVFLDHRKALVDWQVGILDSDIDQALKRRLNDPATHVPIDLRGIPAVRAYMSCTRYSEIAACAAVIGLVIKWIAERAAVAPQ